MEQHDQSRLHSHRYQHQKLTSMHLDPFNPSCFKLKGPAQ